MKIYTRTGDDGLTALADGTRVPKFHPRVDANGNLDELIAWIGLLRDQITDNNRRELLVYIQDQLMRCAASIAAGSNHGEDNILLSLAGGEERLEAEIDKMEATLPELNAFILPGGVSIVSYCNIARCVCRRAERSIVFLNEKEFVHELIIRFLNRLSDFLFVLGRKISLELDIEEVKWQI